MQEGSRIMFSVGDRVIHCIHGAGIVVEKKKMRVTGKTDRYVVIDLLGSRSTLMVPTDGAEQRLRPVSKMATLRRLLMERLASQPDKLPTNYKKRAQQIRDKLKSGRAKKWIEVIRDLMHRDEQKSLSPSDQKLLDRAMSLLSGELALARGIAPEKAKDRLASILQHRHEFEDQQVETKGWLQTLTEKVVGSFTKRETQATADAGR
jgi:CarD family transcriptional regulator